MHEPIYRKPEEDNPEEGYAGGAQGHLRYCFLKTKVKKWLVPTAGAIVMAGVTLNVQAYKQAHAMMHFIADRPRTDAPESLTFAQKVRALLCGVDIPRPRTTGSPLDLATETRSLRLKCTGGITLGAWYCPAEPQKPLVILFHGYSSEKSSTISQAKAFRNMGLSVLLVDFRGSGESSES